MTWYERVADNPQWQEDNRFIGDAMLNTSRENLPRIRGIIEAYPGASQENWLVRKGAYLALVRHLRDFPDPELMCWHLAQLPKESDKYVLHDMLSEMEDWSDLPAEADLTPLLACVEDSRFLVHQDALRALSCADREEARQAVRPLLRLDPIRENRTEYACLCQTLARIGTIEDLPVLEELRRRAGQSLQASLSGTIFQIQKRVQGGGQGAGQG